MAAPSRSFSVPYSDAVVSAKGVLTSVWAGFFRALYEAVLPLGFEYSSQIANNQSSAADIENMKVSERAVSYAHVEYLVQRVTTETGATELVESGQFELLYRPTDAEWVLHVLSEETPDDAGIDFSVTAVGQVQYTTSNISGTASISRIVWRMRTLAGKSAQYSSQGARL